MRRWIDIEMGSVNNEHVILIELLHDRAREKKMHYKSTLVRRRGDASRIKLLRSSLGNDLSSANLASCQKEKKI